MIMLLSRSDSPEILLTCLSVMHLNVIFHIHFVPVSDHTPVYLPKTLICNEDYSLRDMNDVSKELTTSIFNIVFFDYLECRLR